MLTPTAKNGSFPREFVGHNDWRAEFIPVSGGYMIRVNGFPLFNLGVALAIVADRLDSTTATTEEIVKVLGAARQPLEFAATQSILPVDSKNSAQFLLNNFVLLLEGKVELNAVAKGQMLSNLSQFNTILARDLYWMDLYLIEPKLGYNTLALLTDASTIFPKSIREVLSDRIKYEVQQAANCLGTDMFSAVGFHVLRAVELVILDYFTLPGWSGKKPETWSEYARELRRQNVHPKIRAMITRLAELHRNELMHADAVLSGEEAAMLFALMQEVVPVMIADVAKRKGHPIAEFAILNDPRWQVEDKHVQLQLTDETAKNNAG